MGKNLLMIFIIGLMPVIIQAQEWELKKNEKGIKAYTRDYPSLKFKEYLVTTSIPADIKTVITAFTDFSQYHLLYPETADYEVLEKSSELLVSYMRIKTPFPAKDRAGIFQNKFTYNPASKTIYVEISCLNDKHEVASKYIRIPYCTGYWEFKEVEENVVEVKHQFVTDPGGFAPAFIVNAKTINNPFKTLEVLTELSSQEKYRKHDSVFAKAM